MRISRPFAMLVSLAVLSCRDRAADSPPAIESTTAKSPAAKSPPRQGDSAFDAARRMVLADTSSPAYKQLNLMSAPIQTLQLAARASDTLRWTAQRDSCGLLIVSRHVPVRPGTPGDNAFLVAEWFGSAEFGDVWDIAPSPKWDWIAYGQARRIKTDLDLERAAAETKTTQAELLTRIIRSADGARYLTIPVVTSLLDACSGNECPLDAVSPLLGGTRVGWNDEGTLALFSGPESPPHWRGVRPRVRDQPVDSVGSPALLNWASRAIPDVVNNPPIVSGGGAYRFESRHDSIFVSGPDRKGMKGTRYVGPGIPVAATRNGQYLLAVRPERDTRRAVIYEFTLFHAMMSSSCDRADAH